MISSLYKMASNKYKSCLTGLPTEILLEIYHNLDLASIYQLSLTSQLFAHLFALRKVAILLPVLSRDFSPFDELLQVYTAKPEDLICTNRSLYKVRKVIFRRYAGDTGVLMTPALGGNSQVGITNAATTKEGGRGLLEKETRTVILTEKDLKPILKSCRLVQEWEEIFPQMRWFYQPEDCRYLRPHESVRFRQAFYRWWLYGFYFHQGLPPPHEGLPDLYVDDIRTSLLRYYSTSDLLELMDLVETMKDVVLQYICPRIDPEQQNGEFIDLSEFIPRLDRGLSQSNGWTASRPWARILKTYAKLGPEKLMHYFKNISSYPRKRLIAEVSQQHPYFTRDQETIQHTIRTVLDERQWLTTVPQTLLAEESKGGIIDFDDARDQERELFRHDGSANGSLPPGVKLLKATSWYVPRGDDGSYLDNTNHPIWDHR